MDGHRLPADVRRRSPPRRTDRRPAPQAPGLHDRHVRVHDGLAGQRVRLQRKRDRPCPRCTGSGRRAHDTRRAVPGHDHLLRRPARQGARDVGCRRWTRHRRRRGGGWRPHHLGGLAVDLLGQRPGRGGCPGCRDQGPAPAHNGSGPAGQVRPRRRRDRSRRTGRTDVRPRRGPQPRLDLAPHDHGARGLGRAPGRVHLRRTPRRPAPRPPAHVVAAVAGLRHRRHAGRHRSPGRRGVPRARSSSRPCSGTRHCRPAWPSCRSPWH